MRYLLIPTPLKGPTLLTTQTEPACGRSNVPTEAQPVAGINDNLAALLVTAGVCLAVAWFFWLRSINRSAGFTRALLVASMLLVAMAVLFIVDAGMLRTYGQVVAAIGLFVAIGVVVAMSAFTLSTPNPGGIAPPQGFATAYRLILAVMIVVLVAMGVPAILNKFEHAVFWLGASEIALFATFWVTPNRWSCPMGSSGRPRRRHRDRAVARSEH